MGTQLIDIYRNKIKKEWKIAFLSTFIVGMLVHLYKFTNTLMNHDSLFNYYSDQNMTASGRWFLSIACGFSSYFDLPWVIGLFSIILIALTAVLIADIFEMKNPVLIVLCGAILVAFPGITETLFFEFTADGYMLAMLLAALSVWLTRMEKPGVVRTIIAAVCICLTCGTYQAYVSFGLVLAFAYVIYKILKGQNETGEYLRYAGRQAIIYIAGLVVYYVVWQLAMMIQNVSANDYQGISSLSFSFLTVLRGIPNTVRTLFFFFLEWNVFEHGWTLYGALNVIFLCLFIAFLIMAIIKRRMLKRKTQLLLLIIALIAIPFSSCMWVFTSEDVGYRPMMLQSLCILYILFAVLAEEFLQIKWKNIAAVLLTVIVFNYGLMANIAYYYMNQEYEASYAMASEILYRIHLMDTDADTIAVVASEDYNVALDSHDDYANKIHIFSGLLEENYLYDSIHMVLFLNNTFDCEYSRLSTDETEALAVTEEVSEMGIWPASDSVQVIGDTIVIKLSDVEDD